MRPWERRLISVGVVAVICVALAVVLGGNLFETVGKGTYQVKQAAISGTMSAKMTPGFWMQMFGDIQTWPKADTFFFTHDKKEGQGMDQSIEVRFNDGSICNISGTMRIQPASAIWKLS
jgi:hypothetical protein